MAASVQAAAFNWKTSATGKVYGAGSTTLLASGTAYLFDSAATSQSAVLAAFVADGKMASGYIDSSSISSGAITAKSGAGLIDWGSAGDTLNAFFAVISDDMIYIGPATSGAADAVSTTTLSFNAKTSSQAAFSDASAGYAGAGWYQSVPEPTSGLLMLLGMAGLALRRRRA